ncbi:MAG: PKD domain-containing protein, partial [Hydrogenophaga sp.]|nr:PKD domain-containing protein [Hydrogenophaga sp.]
MQFVSRNLMSRPGVALRDIPQAQGEASGPGDPELPPDPVVAQFVGNPLSGYAPLTVNFTDLSTGSPDTWGWNLGGGLSFVSTVQHPTFVYEEPGLYTVSLTAIRSSDAAVDSETKIQYIEVLAPAPPSGPACFDMEWFASQGPKLDFEDPAPPALTPGFADVLNGTVGLTGFFEAVQVWGVQT